MTQKLKRKTITFKTMALLLALSMLIPLMPLRAIAATSEEDLTSNKTEQTTVNEKEPESPLDAIIVEEDVSKRGRNEKHFLCDDGSYIAVSYSEDVHEVVNNEWVDIEYDVGESDGEISPVDEDIKVKFANNTNSSKLVKIDADGYKISWTVEAETEEGEGINKVKLSKESKSAIKTTKEINKQNKEKIKAESKNTYAQVLSYKQMAELAIEKEKNADVENNEKVLYANASIEEYNREQIQSAASYAQSMVEYKDAFGEGLTLRYLLTPGKINEEIVLDSYSGFKSYSMVINTDGLTPVVSENGSVALTDSEGNAVMNIAAPYMYDAIDAISENVSVTATQESKKEWRITYTPDQEWLKDTNRVYPVVIDPEVHTSKNRTDILDAFVYCGQTEYSNNNLPYLRVGYTGYRISNIAYWAVNNLPTIAANSYITGAGLHIRFLDDTEETENIVLYSTTGTLNTNTLNWDNKPTLVSFLDNQATLPTNYWVNFCSQSLGDIIADKYRRGENSLVLAIRYADSASKNTYNEFYSGDEVDNPEYRPYFVVRYTTSFYTVPEGDYYIKNVHSGKYLSVVNGGTSIGTRVTQYNFNGTSSQTWSISKTSVANQEDAYYLSPKNAPSTQLYFPTNTIRVEINNQPDYSRSKWRFERINSNTFSISSALQPWMALDVNNYSTEEGAEIYAYAFHGNNNQLWILEPVVGINPQGITLNIGDTFDLDTIEAFPQTSMSLNWTLVSGAPNVEYNSETNEVLAEKVGTAVFQTLLSDGLYYQFTITIPESRPIPDGYYYIDNCYSQKRIDIGAVNSGGNATLCQQSPNNKSKSQMWYVEYAGSSMYYIYSVSSYRKAINFNATPTANDLAYPLEVNTPAHNYSSWFIVPSNNSQTYTLLTSANTRKSLGVDLDGTTLVAQNRVYGNNHQEWFFIPVQNKPAAEAQIIAVGETVTGTIENVKDFEWYKVIVPGSSKYQIKIDPDMDEDFTSKNYYLEIYSGDSTNPTNLEKMLYTHTGDQLCTIASNSMTESKTYYIKVYPKKNINDTIANVFSIMVSNAPVEGGSELEGWIYRGAYMSPKILYYVDSSMDTIWRGEDSYRTLFMEAIERWNTALSGFTGNEDVFDVTESVSTTKVSLEDAEVSWEGVNDQKTGEIILSYNRLKDYTRQKIVDVIAHELGHTLGLGDLYISQEHGYIYNGQILDNSDHLMYGLGSENLTTSIYGRFHDDDITGVRAIQGNSLSLVKYTEEELYESANFIVKGKVVSTAPYNSRYTRVNFLVEEYLYSQQTVNESIISFLHLGTPEEEYYVSPLYNSGEEYILYLHYDLYDELFVVGGPQGRFLVEEDESGEKTATNQIDRIVEKEAKEIYKLEKKFAKELEKFEKQAKTKIKETKANKKQ